MNSKTDRIERPFILVQLAEDLDENLKHAQKDAVRTLQVAIEYLDGKKLPHNICEIGKERIRRAGVKIKEELAKKVEGGVLPRKIKKLPWILAFAS